MKDCQCKKSIANHQISIINGGFCSLRLSLIIFKVYSIIYNYEKNIFFGGEGDAEPSCFLHLLLKTKNLWLYPSERYGLLAIFFGAIKGDTYFLLVNFTLFLPLKDGNLVLSLSLVCVIGSSLE